MKNKRVKTGGVNTRHAGFSIAGILLFFIPNAVCVTIAVLVYDKLTKTGQGLDVIALILLLTTAFLTVLYAVCDIIRRRVMIDKPVEDILEATERIAGGDFSVRLRPNNTYKQADEFDRIMNNVNLLAQELGKSEILNADFIANASHELKTPLAIIQNYATALQNNTLDEKTRGEYVKTIRDAATRLSVLVADILKLNKLENHKILPETVRFSLSEQLAQAVIDWEDRLESKNLTLDYDVAETEICSTPDLLEIVWNNLISNAVKFTDNGGNIAIRLKTVGKNAVVTVSDSGVGIPPETGKHIFDKFYQGDASHASEGNGLGLALVKKVIDVIGGEIAVQSQKGKGTTFTVTLKNVLIQEV